MLCWAGASEPSACEEGAVINSGSQCPFEVRIAVESCSKRGNAIPWEILLFDIFVAKGKENVGFK